MVNRLWCETVIPILWRKPWCYAIDYRNKNSLYSIITSYLPNDIKELLTKKGIRISSQSLAFDYLSFCKSINIKIIDEIISVGSLSEYNLFLLQEEIYMFLIRKCSEIKYLDICGTYEIVYHPEAKDRLESLCELTFDTSIDHKYFYRISHICQQIQRINIINNNFKVNHGTTKLIVFQKNLKYFKWKDDFIIDDDDYYPPPSYVELLEDPYTEIFRALEKHANTLDHLEISLQFDDYPNYNEYDYTFLQYTLLELHNLKFLKIDSPIFLNSNDDFNEKLEKATYRNLEIFEINLVNIYQVSGIIKNSFSLRELRIHDYYFESEWFIEDSLCFIRTICENCILVEYLTIPVFPLLEDHFIEFEKLLKNCQKLQSLQFLEIYYIEVNELEYEERLLNVLVKEASTNLREIEFSYDIKFSSETLETFFEKWKGRPAVSIRLNNSFDYHNDSYKNLISKYKMEGVIKDINI
ncbi:hypothetical protein GLOIN_2v1764020 [Rhizophagus clarus]|nr:hypothetical protein GLOIN_2v1764020 [Rhizophagus clarus]